MMEILSRQWTDTASTHNVKSDVIPLNFIRDASYNVYDTSKNNELRLEKVLTRHELSKIKEMTNNEL